MPLIRVSDVSFELTLRYEAGNVIGQAEADELNRAYVDLVRERVRSYVRTHPEATANDLEALARSTIFPPLTFAPDPMEREARKIAQGLANEALTKAGTSRAQVGDRAFDELVDKFAGLADVRSEANRRVQATQAAASASVLGDLLTDEGAGV